MAKYNDDYQRVNWINFPNTSTPLNQTLLNRMDSYLKTLSGRIADLSTFTPSIRFVDSLPEQGIEGIFYIESIIEHGFTLDGELPNHFKSQSALDAWINDGHCAFMLHIHTADPNYADRYIIISDIEVSTISNTSGFYEVDTIRDISGTSWYTSYFQYSPETQQWYQHPYYGIEVGDKLIAYNEASSTSTKIGNTWFATDGAISDTNDETTYKLGVENIIGDATITVNVSTHTPAFSYDTDDNTYAIYEAKPIQVLSSNNVYLWSADTHSYFGFHEDYEAGDNITLTEGANSTTIISAKDTTYTAGENVSINDGVISAVDTTYSAGDNIDITNRVISTPSYTAGSNVSIANRVISAVDTTYSAGDNITIDENNRINAIDTKYSAGNNVQINQQGVISATDTTYVARSGGGLKLIGNQFALDIANNSGLVVDSNGVYVDTGDIQEKLTEGYGVYINNGEISVRAGYGFTNDPDTLEIDTDIIQQKLDGSNAIDIYQSREIRLLLQSESGLTQDSSGLSVDYGAVQKKLVDGTGIDITNDVISVNVNPLVGEGLQGSYGQIEVDFVNVASSLEGDGLFAHNGKLKVDYNDVQEKLTAGDNITISNGVISSSGQEYTAGNGIDITNGVISVSYPDGDLEEY